MSNNVIRCWGVLRIVDGQLCFADSAGVFGELSDDSIIYARRNDAYEAAQLCRGLVCQIDDRLARAYGLTATWWPHNVTAIAGTNLAVVVGGAGS